MHRRQRTLQAAFGIKLAAASLHAAWQRGDVGVRRALSESVARVQLLAYAAEGPGDDALALPRLLALCAPAEGAASASAVLAVFLLCAAHLERALADALHSALAATRAAAAPAPDAAEEAVPALLRDLLRSPLLAALLGARRVLLLRLFLAAPAALNARNVAWHGFVCAQEFPAPYALLALALLAALEPLVAALALPALHAPRPVPFLKRRKLSLAAFASAAPLAALLPPPALLCAAPALPRGRADSVAWAAAAPSPVLRAVALLPVVEMALRERYVAVNALPAAMLCAQSRVYYVRTHTHTPPSSLRAAHRARWS